MARLSTIMAYMKRIDEYIHGLRKGMAHTDPYTVDALRQTVEELEAIKESILNADIQSGSNLEKIFEKVNACVRACIRPEYTGKQEVLGKPSPEYWKPPVTVTGVNIIFVVDISQSMFRNGGLEPNGRMRRILSDFSKDIQTRANSASIPCTVSLVWYADPTDKEGKNRPVFWEVALNKDSNINNLTNAFDNVDRSKWAVGSDLPESGMSAIYHTIPTVFDSSIINGKRVENSLILVSDERQKLHGGNPSSHPLYTEVTYNDVLNRCETFGIKNRYALIPTHNGWNSQIIPFFRQVRDYNSVQSSSDLSDWVLWTLDPTQAP